EASARGGVAARRRSLRRYGPLAVLGETRDIGDVLAARAHMADLLGEGRIDA
ncbi:MAG: hypothetical protein GWN71_38770, partial [Gammaproteobacteria bacterium]|nr:hypothetical protein [Gemmatimonadota bacterium]NIU79282.1 hypothetical protein [Gammaproteobacteria bacterium]